MARKSFTTTLVGRGTGACRAQFSLRTLLLLTTACGVWLGLYMRRVAEQKAAVELIRACGGTVLYEYQEKSRGSCNYDPTLNPGLPQWLLAALGEDFFFNVSGVFLGGDELSRDFPQSLDLRASGGSAAELLGRVAALRKLRTLVLDNAYCDDAALQTLGGLTHLERFAMSGSRVTDDGIACLSRLTKLRYLWLKNYRVTDKGLVWLGSLSSLEALGLPSDPVTDAHGLLLVEEATSPHTLKPTRASPASATIVRRTPEALAALTRLNKLLELDLSSNRAVTDDWMRYVAELDALRSLDLCQTGVTSMGIRDLVRLQNLESLELSYNHAIDDSALTFIGELTKLKWLWLSGTCVKFRSLGALRSLKRLETLDLSFNSGTITDEAARALGDISSLQDLDLTGGSVSVSDLHHLTRLKNLRSLRLSLPAGSDFLERASARKFVEDALPRCDTSVDQAEEQENEEIPGLRTVY